MHEDAQYCKNCGQHLLLNQKFCHNCGQKSDTHRINFHFLVHEIQHGIFHVDKGILFTIKELFTRPGFMIKDYIDGKRKNYFPPVTLIMILGSLFALLSHFLGFEYKFFDVNKGNLKISGDKDLSEMQKTGINPTKFADFFESISTWIEHHYALTLLLMIPILALGLYFAFKKYRNYNYAENLVVATFLTGQSLTISILFLFLQKIHSGISSFLFMVIVGFFFWTMFQLYQGNKKRKIFFRGFLAAFITFIFFAISMILIIMIGMLFSADKISVFN